MKYGLIGGRLAHSHSPAIHHMLAEYEYALYPLTPDELPGFLRGPDIGGLNVTIPYKVEVMKYCAALTGEAQRIGSVNTLLYDRTRRRITGHNTDYNGFLYLVGRAGLALKDRKVVILGSGGTSRTVCVAAQDAGAREIVTVSRQGENNYRNIRLHADADILVNTTPVGMYPEMNACPVELDLFDRLAGVLDVVYNPLNTRLVLEARDRGIRAEGGLAMLVAQAHAAAELFSVKRIPRERIEEIIEALSKAFSNIVLIGMPGAGKTEIGRRLSERTGRPFFDTDALVEREAGMSIPDLFALEGEAGFRAREEAAVAEAAREGGRIIATGGGAPMFKENRTLLRQNGRIFHIERDLEELPTKGRPLSKNLAAMYETRAPVYRALAEKSIKNAGTADEAADAVLRAFEKEGGRI
ncbi:MAG TPA: shikimate kinase [Feifaniaceae bacterium]|nr:shikimate kinase [Feifaniaceae bacterium]